MLVVGTGLGGLAAALRLVSSGYQVTMVEQYHQPGGRLNYLEKDGFSWDLGPSFFSMSYEFENLFRECGIPNPLTLQELDPVYTVNFTHLNHGIQVYKDLSRLAHQVEHLEPNFHGKAQKYLDAAQRIFEDTEYRVIKKKFQLARGLFVSTDQSALEACP